MFRKKPHIKTDLEKARDEALLWLPTFPPNSDEYRAIMARIDELSRIIAAERPEKLSPNTTAMVAANLAIAVIVVGYERANIVFSKALNFMMKLR